jgi:Fe-S cluster assembly scaffold protein SufB
MSISEKIITNFENKNTNLNKSLIVKNNETLNYFIYVIAKKTNKKINFVFKQQEKSIVNVFVNCIASNGGNIEINISNEINNKSNSCIVNQEINGLVLDDKSSIKALPIMKISNNKIKASHSVNIGSINKEQLFYLTSRGIKTSEAIKLIINNMFAKVDQKLYNSIIL